jgi:hypothetical protein
MRAIVLIIFIFFIFEFRTVSHLASNMPTYAYVFFGTSDF